MHKKLTMKEESIKYLWGADGERDNNKEVNRLIKRKDCCSILLQDKVLRKCNG